MATYKINLDTRRHRKDGASQLTLFLRHCGGQRTIPLGLHLTPDQWDASAGKVREKHALHRQLNISIARMRLAADEALLGLPKLASLAEAAELVTQAVFPDRSRQQEPEKPSLVDTATRFAAMKAEPSTRLTYQRTITHVMRFRPAAKLDDVSRAWLTDFDAYLAQTSPSPNARAIHMRNLRAVLNFAIDEGLTANYPFRKYKIRTIPTAKRNLGAAQLRELFTMEVEDWQRPYRDFFALSFFLIGANATDILHLGAGADGCGRVEYHRKKTKKLYSVLVEPEAKAIIDRYRGRRFLLGFMDGRTDYLQYIRQCNHALKMIGTHSRQGCKPVGAPLYPGITTYWARHSWATIAAELDIPKETIAAALGHDMGNSTTAIYIDYNRRKVDEANRRVIDFVLYGRR